MEAANGSTDTYTITYDSVSQKFSIKNDSGNTNAIDVLFENASTTAEGLLGFTATDHASIAAGASLTGDTAVGGYRLILNSDSSGTTGRIAIKVDEDNDGVFEESTSETDTTGLSRLAFNPSYDSSGAVSGGIANVTQSQTAVDASLVLDGLTVTRSSNTITDLISGVTIELAEDSAGKTLALTVANNTSDINAKASSFISNYNSAMGLVRSLSVTTGGNAVLFTGDSTARSITTTLRTAITNTYAGKSLAELGLSHDLQATLSLDSSVLDSAINADLDGVIATFDGMAEALDSSLGDLINIAIPARTDGLNSSITQINDRVDNIQQRLITVEASYRRKFGALEQLLGQLEQSGNFLSQALSSLPKANAGGNSS